MKKQSLGVLAIGLMVGLLTGIAYSQQSAVAANGEPHGKLVSGWGTREHGNKLWIWRMWEDGTIEHRQIHDTQSSFASPKWFPIRE